MNSDISWLHLSDFHFGQKIGNIDQFITDIFLGELLGNIESGIRKLPDIILITGDIAFSGKEKEFNLFLKFYNDLLNIDDKWDPVTLVVPGNHDLDRSVIKGATDSLVYSRFYEYTSSIENDTPWKKELNKDLFTNNDPTILNKLFSDFTIFQRRIHPDEDDKRISIDYSHIPGEFYCRIAIPNKPSIGVVGLNSSWLQCDPRDYQGKLCINREQLLWALPEKKLPVLDNNKYNFLIFHHPPSWFHKTYSDEFYNFIFSPSRFDLCMYGHMHKNRSEIKIICGGDPRFEIQADSMCGVENYGSKDTSRSFGFSMGLISERGEIRMWPYRYNPESYGKKFVWNQSYGEANDSIGGALLKKADIACNYNFPLYDSIEKIFSENIDTCTSVTILGMDTILQYHQIRSQLILVSDKCNDVKVIFPQKNNLANLCRLLSLDLERVQNKWEESIKGIRDVLTSKFAGKRWECMEYEGLLPFEALIFNNKRIFVRYLQNGYESKDYMVLHADYPCYNYLTKYILDSISKCTPLMEYNMCGRIKNHGFFPDLLIPESDWRTFRRSPAEKEIYLVSICIPIIRYNSGLNDKFILLKRTEKNSGDAFNKYSLLSGKLNDRDFFKDGIIPRNFLNKKIKPYTTKDAMIDAISTCFFKNIGLDSREAMPEKMLESASRNAISRACRTKLALTIDPTEFEEIHDIEHIIEKSDVKLYVSLFTINLSAAKLEYAKRNRPFSEFEELNVSEFINKHQNDSNDFLVKNFDKIIAILSERKVN